MKILLEPILSTLLLLIDLFQFCLVAYVVLGWLIYFEVINRYNNVIMMVGQTLKRILDPFLDFISRFIPRLGAVDLSALALFVVIFFLKQLVISIYRSTVLGV
ncbi:MAG: hypothetical protein C0432_00605 [Candidatus Puniceispirillum sp.]|nr:hypothetical protein [Candidatus Pelagibacter sp.]MBA4282783.1 hypothetical protein [Candidatus Puniceispirillum sp.]